MDKVHITAAISRETHEKLKEIAKSRGMNLYDTVEKILVWAGEQNALSLYRAGVHLPIFPNEATQLYGRDFARDSGDDSAKK